MAQTASPDLQTTARSAPETPTYEATEKTVDVCKAIGRNIQRVRRSHGMDAAEFAEAMTEAGHKMSITTVSRLENGHRGVGVDELLAAAYVLGTSPLALVYPAPGESLDIGGGVSVGGDEAGDWFVHAAHPREDVDGAQFAALEPPALRAIRSELREMDEKREKVERTLGRLGEVIGLLTPEDLETFQAVLRGRREDDK